MTQGTDMSGRRTRKLLVKRDRRAPKGFYIIPSSGYPEYRHASISDALYLTPAPLITYPGARDAVLRERPG